jgi:hypothetical protein
VGGFASYLDGVPVARRNAANVPIPNHNASLYFGRFDGTSEFTEGYLDEIAVWSLALTEEEVRAGWYKKLTGNEPGLVGYWNFQADWPEDLSPNQHHGSANGDAAIILEDIPGLDGFASTVIADPGPFSLTGIATGRSWEVWAFRDVNGNERRDVNEPFGAFSGNPINPAADLSNVDITLFDHPAIRTEPMPARVLAGGIATFTVNASGSQPLSYQWRKDGVAMADAGRISGALSGTLTINEVRSSDAGAYSVVISNSAGAATSKTVTLAVIEGGARIGGTISYDGTQTGDILITAAQVMPANQVLTFDGITSYASTTLTDLSGPELTIQFWWKGPRLNSAVRQQSGGYIVAGWGNNLHLISNDRGTDGISGGEAATDGNWHHVVFTWKQNTPGGFASYLDGQLVERRDSSNTPIPNHAAQVYFGAWNGTAEFALGSIDEIAIWRRALTETEIASNWNRPLTGNEAGLAGYWNFDDGHGSDLSGNGNHAELWNTAAIVPADIPGSGGEFVVHRINQPGAYTLPPVLTGSNFQVTAFLDANGNGVLDPGEPSGTFPGNPFDLTADRNDVNIQLLEAPRLLAQTIQGRGAPGAPVTLKVAASGTAPISYQWHKDGIELANGGQISGAQSPELRIGALSAGNEGRYHVVVSNAQGQTASRDIPVLVIANGRSISGTLALSGEQRGNIVLAAAQFQPDNKVLDLTAPTAHVIVNSLRDLSGEALTVEYWFRGNSFQSAVRQQSQGWIVSGWSGLHILSHDGGTAGISAGQSITDGTWHHLLMTWEQDTMGGFASYLDGKLVTSRDTVFDWIPFHDAPLYFGALNGTSEFTDGQLDQIAVWNRSLTEAEAVSRWSKPLSGTEPGLVGYWDFDDGTANDRSPNAHHGVLISGAAIVQSDVIPPSSIFTDLLDQAGSFVMANIPPGDNYHLFAFIDLNGNGIQDEGEPVAAYLRNPFALTANLSDVNLDLSGAQSTPALTVSSAAGQIQISWPADFVGFVLESTASLSSPQWLPVTGVTGNSATLPITGAARFYRLRK